MQYNTKTLQHKLVIQVSLGMFIFSFFAGLFTYYYAYKRQLEESKNLQSRLVSVIKSQAEVAVFAYNEDIGREIIDGLLTSPIINGVKIESKVAVKVDLKSKRVDSGDIFQLEQAKVNGIDYKQGNVYKLFSPVDKNEEIGSIILVQNDGHILDEAKKISTEQTILMLLQLLMSAILIVWVSRRGISKPVSDLAKEVVAIQPGDNSRINVLMSHAYDEIGMLSDSINSLIDSAETALAESAAARQAAEAANRARSEFLDNSGEGFLSFGLDMIIDPEYSRECMAIFEDVLLNYNDSIGGDFIRGDSIKDKIPIDINGLRISELLFRKDDSDRKNGFEKTVELIFNEPLDLKKELYISLLQPFYQIGEKHIKAKYKLIDNDNKIMVVLKDITREKVLEKHVENERKRLKFVISAVREVSDFFTILDDLKQFKLTKLPILLNKFQQIKGNNHKDILYEVYRQIHTFKGLFAQQEFLTYPEFLHNMESRISKIIGKMSGLILPVNNGNANFNKKDVNNHIIQIEIDNSRMDITSAINNEFRAFVDDFKNETVLEQDLIIIRTFLGDDFIEHKGDVIISSELASQIESMAENLISIMGNNIDNETVKILEQVKRLRHVDIKSLLTMHVEGALRLSERLNKYVYPFQVEGDEVKVHPDRFRPFIRSLVNVFRNAVDHGIEMAEERIELEKDEYATIECKVRKVDNSLVEISISDDGRGIDINTIKSKVVSKGLMTIDQINIMDKNELLQLIFLDDFSTRETADAMSGRGMGLSGVKTELEKIQGRVEIETEMGNGTCFKFYIPI